jgi:hypothetical protein
MHSILINGKKARIDHTKKQGSWLVLFVNGYQSAHSIPAQWFDDDNDRRGLTVSGNTYKKAQA